MMRADAIRVCGLAVTLAYGALIVWVYGQQPQTVSQLTGGVTASVGLYRVDQASFDEGLARFRGDRFPEARAALERADPARRDARTQFYIAYSYYREGWGRIHSDDALFRLGVEAASRSIALAGDGRLVVDDPDLGMTTASELKAELDRGLAMEVSDFNPLRILRKRK